jgi:hypothetical protein
MRFTPVHTQQLQGCASADTTGGQRQSRFFFLPGLSSKCHRTRHPRRQHCRGGGSIYARLAKQENNSLRVRDLTTTLAHNGTRDSLHATLGDGQACK